MMSNTTPSAGGRMPASIGTQFETFPFFSSLAPTQRVVAEGSLINVQSRTTRLLGSSPGPD